MPDISPPNMIFFRKAMPYCLRKITSPEWEHVWLPLNRDYKPLGMIATEWVDYKEHDHAALVFIRDPVTFKNVWAMEDNDLPGHLWLYDDGIYFEDDLSDYFTRLERLMKHKHVYHTIGEGSLIPLLGHYNEWEKRRKIRAA